MSIRHEYIPCPDHDDGPTYCWYIASCFARSGAIFCTSGPYLQWPGPVMPDLREVINLIKIGYSR